MTAIFPAYTIVEPSYIAPEIIVQQNQASNAFDLIAGSNPAVRLGEGDQYVYLRTLQIRTQIAAGQAAYNQLPSCDIIGGYIQTPTYLQRVQAQYDHHDTAAAARWNVGLPGAQSLAMRQAHFQNLRGALLYGYNPQLGEGLTNGVGVINVNLPPDSNGNQSAVTYDNGEMAFFFLQQVGSTKTLTYQLGIGRRVSIVGPQRILELFEYPGIVQLVQFQREGAGSATTKGLIQDVLNLNGDTLEWGYDDTLIGKGQGGSDLVIISIPEIENPRASGMVNTNEFANITPSLAATSLQMIDMAAPREIPTPIPYGGINVLSEMRTTSGWPVRPEALRKLSMPYDE